MAEVKVIRALAEEQWEAMAEGISSLAHSEGYPQLLELLARVEQLAKDAAIDGKPEDLPLHRGWRDCASYLQQQLQFLPQVAEQAREARRVEKESPDVGEYVSLLGLASGAGNL
jgi:hypothetical protein